MLDTITVRQMPFEFCEEIDPVFIEGDHQRSFGFIAGSLLLPYLEPYLMRTMKAAEKHVTDPKILADLKAFAAQEGQHYRTHSKFNRAIRRAGFPGLVLAALCDAELHLVESDQKKAVFLQTVIRETGIRAIVHNKRIESLPPIAADIVTARALASLDRLLELLEAQLVPGTRCLFLKGARAEAELATLDTRSDIIHRLHPSLTNPEAFVVDLMVTS